MLKGESGRATTSPDDARRNLQFETRAHIRVKEALDAEHAAGSLAD